MLNLKPTAVGSINSAVEYLDIGYWAHASVGSVLSTGNYFMYVRVVRVDARSVPLSAYRDNTSLPRAV